jgi:hypothetical protein
MATARDFASILIKILLCLSYILSLTSAYVKSPLLGLPF